MRSRLRYSVNHSRWRSRVPLLLVTSWSRFCYLAPRTLLSLRYRQMKGLRLGNQAAGKFNADPQPWRIITNRITAYLDEGK